MDPILSWIVCLLSAFLLVAGGFLFARAAAARRYAGRLEELTKLKATTKKLLEERQTNKTRVEQLEKQCADAQKALKAQGALSGRDFGGPTQLPNPKPYFDQDEGPQAFGDMESMVGGHDDTKQFNLHSPENVVQFMQRIDEITEENRELRELIEQQQQTLKEKQSEGNEQIHRFAALDATAEKLRAELKRRNERIKSLEDQLNVQLASDDGPLTAPGDVKGEPTQSSDYSPPPPPIKAFTADKTARPSVNEAGQGPKAPTASPVVDKHEAPTVGSIPAIRHKNPFAPNLSHVAGPHDGPTLKVPQMSSEDLEEEE